MKNRVYKAVAALCAVFLVVVCFVPALSVRAAAADVETTPWVVDIINAGENSFSYADNYQLTSGAVDRQPWSVRVGPGGNGFVFTYSIPSLSGFELVEYSWTYPADLEIVEFTVVSGSVTKTFTAGQIASADMFATSPYKYGNLPTVVKIASKAERELNFWQKVDHIFDLLKFFVGGTPQNIFTYLGSFLPNFNAVLNDIKGLLSVSGDSDDLDTGTVEDFEQDHFDRIESGLTDLENDIDVGFLSPAFAFIGGRVTTLYSGMGAYRVVLILPIFIGVLFILTRFNPRNVGMEDFYKDAPEPKIHLHAHKHVHYSGGKYRSK